MGGFVTVLVVVAAVVAIFFGDGCDSDLYEYACMMLCSMRSSFELVTRVTSTLVPAPPSTYADWPKALHRTPPGIRVIVLSVGCPWCRHASWRLGGPSTEVRCLSGGRLQRQSPPFLSGGPPQRQSPQGATRRGHLPSSSRRLCVMSWLSNERTAGSSRGLAGLARDRCTTDFDTT